MGHVGFPHGPSSAQPLSALSADLLCPLLTKYRGAAPLWPDQTRSSLHSLLHHTPATCIPLCPEPVRAPLPDLLHRRLHNWVPRAALGLLGSTSAP